MIGRLWHGWTGGDKADGYGALVRIEILPGFKSVLGFDQRPTPYKIISRAE